MTDMQGRRLSLAVDDDTRTGTFLAIASLCAERLMLDEVAVDEIEGQGRTHSRELTLEGGFAQVSLSGRGFLDDAQGDIRLQRLFLDGAVVRWRIAAPGFGTLEGPLRITSLDCSSRRLGAADFGIGLASAGRIEFAASAAFSGD